MIKSSTHTQLFFDTDDVDKVNARTYTSEYSACIMVTIGHGGEGTCTLTFDSTNDAMLFVGHMTTAIQALP